MTQQKHAGSVVKSTCHKSCHTERSEGSVVVFKANFPKQAKAALTRKPLETPKDATGGELAPFET
jgi:hypothetical protein